MKLNLCYLILIFSLSSFVQAKSWFKYKVTLKKGSQVYAKDMKEKGVYLLGKIKSKNKKTGMAVVGFSDGTTKTYDINNLKVFNPPTRFNSFKKGELVLVEKKISNTQYFLKARIIKRIGRKYSVFLQSSKLRKKTSIIKGKVKKMMGINKVNVPECGRVNLLYKKWTKSTGMPQYNQGPDGMCYAYTGLQMIDFYREAYGTKITRNMALGDAIYGGLISRVYQKEKRMSGVFHKEKLGFGKSHNVIDAVRKYGMCRADIIQKSLKKFAHNKNVNTQEFYFLTLYFLTHYTKNIDSEATPPTRARALEKFFDRLDEDEKVEAADRTVGNYINSRRGRRWGRNIRKNIDIQKVREFMDEYIARKDYVGFMKNVFSECMKKENIILSTKRLPKLIIKGKRDLKYPMKLYSLMTRQLNRKKPTGIGISYCAKILKKPQYVGFIGRRTSVDSKCGNHASLVVGKRARGGRCQFLVRNTWGNSCRYKWECERNQKGKEEGIWIDAEALINNIYEIQYFKPK